MPRHSRHRLVTELVKFANGNAPRGTFHHAVNAVAADINKDGIRKQIQFLLNYLGPAASQTLVSDLMKLETRINDLTSQAIRSDRLGLLIRTTYHMKIKEAHQIAHSKPRTIVRHLVRELGVEKVNKLIHGVANVGDPAARTSQGCQAPEPSRQRNARTSK